MPLIHRLCKRHLEASWGRFGRLEGVMEAILASWNRFGGLLGQSGAVLEASWRRLCALWNRHEGHADTELAEISPTLAKIAEILKKR